MDTSFLSSTIELIQQASGYSRAYLGEIGLAMFATLLVLYGDKFNRLIKRLVSPYHFLIRTSIFVLICAFGYGALTVLISPLFSHWLGQLSNLYLLPVLVLCFITLGLLAERKQQI